MAHVPHPIRKYIGTGGIEEGLQRLSAETRIPPRTLRSYMLAERDPRGDNAVALVAALRRRVPGVTASDLMTWTARARSAARVDAIGRPGKRAVA